MRSAPVEGAPFPAEVQRPCLPPRDHRPIGRTLVMGTSTSMLRAFALAVVLGAGASSAHAATDVPAPDTAEKKPEVDEWLSLHFQTTVAVQGHPAFQADYSGQNSLRPDAE